MRHAYVTKRIAPAGYVSVTMPLAALLYDEGYAVTLCGNNINSFHVFNGWHLGRTIQKEDSNTSFETLLANFMFYLERELGTYPVFYVKRDVIANMDLSILKGTTP